ncbi:hypothetical protein TB2_038487 [Malus domestica]
MDKLNLSQLGERLKIGGAQMGRMVSGKMKEMKEILQVPTPESKMIDEATLETMEEPNWGMNLRIVQRTPQERKSVANMLEAAKDPAINLFGKTISVLSSGSDSVRVTEAPEPDPSSGTMVEETVDQDRAASSSSNSSPFVDPQSHTQHIPKLEDFLGDSSSMVRYSDRQTEPR